MNDQDKKNLTYLNHVVRNNIQKINGLFKEIEGCLKIMREALTAFLMEVEDDKSDWWEDKGG